jgi:hypothetical protein
MTDLVVDTAAQGGAHPQPRVPLTPPRAELSRRADHRRRPVTSGTRVWRGFDMIYLDSAGVAAVMNAGDEDNGKALKSLGLAK